MLSLTNAFSFSGQKTMVHPLAGNLNKQSSLGDKCQFLCQ